MRAGKGPSPASGSCTSTRKLVFCPWWDTSTVMLSALTVPVTQSGRPGLVPKRKCYAKRRVSRRRQVHSSRVEMRFPFRFKNGSGRLALLARSCWFGSGPTSHCTPVSSTATTSIGPMGADARFSTDAFKPKPATLSYRSSAESY